VIDMEYIEEINLYDFIEELMFENQELREYIENVRQTQMQ